MLSANLCSKAVSRSMAGSAMANAIREIRTPVPLRIVRPILFVRALVEKQQFPPGEEESHIQGKREVIFLRPCLHRLSSHHECVERRAICVVDQCEVVVREG